MNTKRLTGCKYVDEYINYCRSEKYLICENHKKMISLILDIFENENLQWNNKEIEKYLSYQKYFSYELFEWEKFVFVLHNCIRDENGLLRFNQIFIYIGRGNGKNGYLSFEDFCLLTPTNKVKKYDIDICSNSEEQSKTTFMDIKEIFDDNKKMFKKFFKWNLTEIKCLHNGNRLKYRTSSAKTKDGLRTSKIDLDECFTGDTEILTNKGYIRFDKLQDEKVAQWDDGIIEFVKPIKKIKRMADEIVVNNLGYGKKLKTTKNHNIVYVDDGEVFIEKAINKVKNGHIVLRGQLRNENKHLTDEERLIICTQADGTIRTNKKQKEKQTRYHIMFKKERKNKRFLSLNPKNLKMLKCRDGYNRYSYTLNTAYAKRLDKCFNLEDFDYTKAKEFIDEVVKWDGCIRSAYVSEYCSIVKENADFVSAVATLCGYSVATYTQRDTRENRKDIYRVKMSSKNNIQSRTFNKNKQVVQHNDYVYCVEVPSHKIVIKSDGKSLVCGNCHQYQDYKMIEVMITGLGKKADSRITFITTNGEVRGGVLDDYLNKCNKILNREIDDNGFLPFLCHIESEEEVDDEKMWYKANPSLQYLPNLLKEMKSEYVDYKLDPNKNTSFMNKRMNFYKQSTEELVAKWEDIAKTNQQTELRHKQNVILGIDFSKTTDFISVCVVGLNNGFTDVSHHSFWCKQSNDKQYVKVPLDEFEKKGFVTQIDDVEINIDVVMEYINKMKQEYNIVMCCIDSYRYSFVSSKLAKLGFCKGNENLKLTRPSDIMNTVTSISSLFVNNKLRVGDDALFRWFTNNTKLVPKPNNNFYYEKIEKRSRKTDGFMAFVNAYTSIDLLEMKQINFIKPIIL